MIDTMDKATARVTDTNGFFEIKGNPISKVGVFPYSGRSTGAENPDSIVYVYRPAEELGSDECIDSFKLLPFVDEHHMIGDGAIPAEQKGVHGVIGEDVYFDGDTLYSNIKVFSQSLANLIEGGKRELSCGYRCTYEFASGEHNGVKYDAIQRNIRGNHLALVEEGRMGHEVAVLDSMVFTFDTKEFLMNEEVKTEEVAKDAEIVGGSVEERLAKIEALLTKLVPLEKAEHGAALDEEIVAEDEEVVVKDEAPKAEGMDAAEMKKSVIKEIAQRDNLYKKLSPIVGAFDHSEMSLSDMAAYGAKKLNLTAMDSASALPMVEGYLVAHSVKATAVVTAMDSAKNSSEIADYLKGAK